MHCKIMISTGDRHEENLEEVEFETNDFNDKSENERLDSQGSCDEMLQGEGPEDADSRGAVMKA